MFGPNMADKYALATTKKLCLVHNYHPYTSGNFLIMYVPILRGQNVSLHLSDL